MNEEANSIQYKDSIAVFLLVGTSSFLCKTTKSIIGKLSREGDYERSVYKNKSGDLPVRKAEICRNIAENLGLEIENLVGLEKAPKSTLSKLEQATGAEQDQK